VAPAGSGTSRPAAPCAHLFRARGVEHVRAPVARLGEQRLRLPLIRLALALGCALHCPCGGDALRFSTCNIACHSSLHHLRSKKRFSAAVPVKRARCTACFSVTATVPATESLSVTSTLRRPSISSFHAIALQRTIGTGILRPTLAAAAAL
jgi:hypothetical protein